MNIALFDWPLPRVQQESSCARDASDRPASTANECNFVAAAEVGGVGGGVKTGSIEKKI